MASDQKISTYSDINWHLLWQNARAEKSWKSKTADDWSSKASSFAERVRKTPYVDHLLTMIAADQDTTILDVGCGPGTLTIPLAGIAKSITAIDYSSGMIGHVEKEAKRLKLANVKTITCSWEDDWQDHNIGQHDIAIASRSMNIDNLEAGIRKLDSHASKQVIITDRIAPSPFNPDLFNALGRKFNSGPDYIYTLNTLYQLGIHPRVDHIRLPSETMYANMDEALDAHRWMLKKLSVQEEKLLVEFLATMVIKRDGNGLVITNRYPQKWAVISWIKEPFKEYLSKKGIVKKNG